ncbi:hypothetical protein [Marinobacter qingdaonensis]|uniref:Uncharacterized protein n=1 Tax=Marinobacter qingdaonensis TaxID=3108486 RepID=A0ABU5P050_9GAMM|nr:hypothetical protein [Marinobacter sp. ASW11-75]MEA1081433.1 hypothetical protein [Marinobacter sp. ASW11-75]
MIPVLILTPYFAPQTHAAMFRVHKLAKYLPEFGFKPIIVTSDTNYLYNEDPRLLEELPDCVEVHRARHIEPTIRGLRMAMGGKDRTFAALKRKSLLSPLSTGGKKETQGINTRPRLNMGRIVRVLAEWPDRYWTWDLAVRHICRDLIRKHEIRLLYTTAIPTSPLRSALFLQKEFELQWVADFRDPVGYGSKHTARGLLGHFFEQRIMNRTMASASMVTGLSGAYGGIFFDLYGLPESRFRFIPTGLDQAYLDDTAEQRQVFIHVGEVMPNQSAHAFSVMARAAELEPECFAGFRLEVVGRRDINQPLVEKIVGGIPSWSIPIDFIDHIPQGQLYRRIRTSRGALLIPGRHRYWWTNFAKLVDYIGLGVPVVADVPPISEAREELRKTGNAHFLGGSDVDSDARSLLQWMDEEPTEGDKKYQARYTARQQAKEFASIYHDLLKREGN